MALNRVDNPVAIGTPPTGTTGYTYQNNKLDALTLGMTPPWPISGSNVVKGSLFNVSGVIYKADSDTAISGTASNYVKITPSGATASAAFVSSLTGVSWDDDYNGYYDVSGNLYVFDEKVAAYAGEISTYKIAPIYRAPQIVKVDGTLVSNQISLSGATDSEDMSGLIGLLTIYSHIWADSGETGTVTITADIFASGTTYINTEILSHTVSAASECSVPITIFQDGIYVKNLLASWTGSGSALDTYCYLRVITI